MRVTLLRRKRESIRFPNLDANRKNPFVEHYRTTFENLRQMMFAPLLFNVVLPLPPHDFFLLHAHLCRCLVAAARGQKKRFLSLRNFLLFRLAERAAKDGQGGVALNDFLGRNHRSVFRTDLGVGGRMWRRRRPCVHTARCVCANEGPTSV